MSSERTSSDERTERATPKRREEARREGRVARSAELSAAAVLLAGAATLASVGGASLAGFAFRALRASASTLSLGAMNTESAIQVLRTLVMQMGIALLPFAAAVLAAGLLVNLVQTGGMISFERLQPKLSNLNPLTGIQRILSADSAFTALKSIAKLAALGCLTYSVVRNAWPELASLTHSAPATTAVVVRTLLLKLSMVVGLAFLAVAAVDYAFQRFQHEKRLRMTPPGSGAASTARPRAIRW